MHVHGMCDNIHLRMTKSNQQLKKIASMVELHTSLSSLPKPSISLTVLMQFLQKPLFPLTHRMTSSLMHPLHNENVHV